MSILLHLIVIVQLVSSVPDKSSMQTTVSDPIQVTIQARPEPKPVASPELISPHPHPEAKKKPAPPTSLPGDRPRAVVTKKMAPTYPKTAMNNEWEGTVVVSVTVSPSGTPISVMVTSSSGHRSLDQAFVRAIKTRYRFKPKRVMGKNTSSTLTLRHTFSLKEPL